MDQKNGPKQIKMAKIHTSVLSRVSSKVRPRSGLKTYCLGVSCKYGGDISADPKKC